MGPLINKIHFGDALTLLKTWPDGFVNTCVTSPPYFGLRDYGTAAWDGGRPDCDHLGEPFRTKASINQNCGTGDDVKNQEARQPFLTHCGKCGARRVDSQMGLEATPEEYVSKMVELFHEVRRVLRDDGTLWLNIGDSYARSAQKGGSGFGGKNQKYLGDNYERARAHTPPNCKEKDLIGIPWMLAFALRADGWYLRQDIIWAKPNPMPESVTDRCTKSHEYIFLLSKSAQYYYDSEAIAEPVAFSSIERLSQDVGSQEGSHRAYGKTNGPMKAVERAPRDSFKREGSKREIAIPGQSMGTHRPERQESEWDTIRRNKRSVWTVSTKPYKGAHFATFPADLIEPCILAGAPAGGVVLDPFMGSGTTAQVAEQLGRQFIGCELNPEYEPLQRERLQQQALAL